MTNGKEMIMPSLTLTDVCLTDDDRFLFAEGTWYESHKKLGAHQITQDCVQGFYFAVWAPNVKRVSVVGDFNNWDVYAHELAHKGGGIWEGFVAESKPNDRYKFFIEPHGQAGFYKADPYARFAELRPNTASVLQADDEFVWSDANYQKKRAHQDIMHEPLNIFECHLGSWKRKHAGYDPYERSANPLSTPLDETSADEDLEWTCAGDYLSYDDFAIDLVQYVKDMGYSHIELLPLMEHPYDGSWGYQITGYYAPTSRFGTPTQLKHLIDACHAEGIGVILDWVPGGFCKDEHGLGRFNGEKLFEELEHPNWGTYKFDLGRGEVRSFLISNLLYWIEEFHADGIRVDGVSSMLYLNFGIDDPAQKRFNSRGNEEDDNSIAFLRQCNEAVIKRFPSVMMIAEESTAWPLVTYPPEDGGLGFHFKWDMGWMNDTLHYMQSDFPYRKGVHNYLTFTTMYQFNENFILPLSHDEVVHGKCSLIKRQPGDYWRQFAGMRALALYQMAHAGGKLNFMGNEIAQFIEWRYYEGIQYFLTKKFEAHRAYQHYIQALNHLYAANPAFWVEAFDPSGFSWIDADNRDQSIIVFARHGHKATEDLIILLNFEVNPRNNFRIGAPRRGWWQEIFSTDASEFGGSGVSMGADKIKTEDVSAHGKPQSLVVTVPPLGGIVMRCVRSLPPLKPKTHKATSAAATHTKASRQTSQQTSKKPADKKGM